MRFTRFTERRSRSDFSSRLDRLPCPVSHQRAFPTAAVAAHITHWTTMSNATIRTVRRPAKSSTAAATRPSKSKFTWRTARRPGRRPQRGQHRRARGRRTARRRQEALPRQGRAQGRRATSTTSSPRPWSGMDVVRPGRHRPNDARARRHAEQGQARGQRDPRRLAGRRPRRRERRSACRSTATSAAPTPRCCRCR